MQSSLGQDVAKFIDIDSALERAKTNDKPADLLIKLIEVALTYNLGDYEKGRTFDELLLHFCKYINQKFHLLRKIEAFFLIQARRLI